MRRRREPWLDVHDLDSWLQLLVGLAAAVLGVLFVLWLVVGFATVGHG